MEELQNERDHLKFKYRKESDLDDLFSRLNDWQSHAEGPVSYGTVREQT
jgi:hypothetical protein